MAVGIEIEPELDTSARPAQLRKRTSERKGVDVTWLVPPTSFRNSEGIRIIGLAVGDGLSVLVAAFLGFLAATLLRDFLNVEAPHTPIPTASLVVTFLIPCLTVVIFSGSWGHYQHIKPFWSEARDLLKIVAYATALSAGLMFVLQLQLSRLWLGSTFALMCIVSPIGRLLAKRVLIQFGHWYVPMILVGDHENAADCARAVDSDWTFGYQVAVRIETEFPERECFDERLNQLTTVLNEAADCYPQARLMLAFDRTEKAGAQQSLVDMVAGRFAHVIIGRPMHGLSAVNAEVVGIDKYDTLFVRVSTGGIGGLPRIAKRAIDISLASLFLLLLSPLLLVLTVLIKRDGGPAIFRSRRVGRDGVVFDALKFRTMFVNADELLAKLLRDDPVARQLWSTEYKLKLDPRVTAVGTWLRRTSLDELPQLLNVIRGEMSLVGPRPILPEEVLNYGRHLPEYHGVLPGITGLWQVSGRNDLGYDERIALNLWYVRNWSLWLDITILLRTVRVVLQRSGAY